ncbi:glycoside hydrolase family 6 protein [Geodermatophilus sp. SYSU D00758]
MAYGTSVAEPASLPAANGTSLSELASSLYVDPDSQAAAWVESNPDDPAARAVSEHIADQPTGKWFGAWSGDITAAVSDYTAAAADAGQVPVLVAYNIPGRDCGGESAGGVTDESGYRRWIDGFAAGLGDGPALVVLEPDALAQLDSCLGEDEQRDRLDLLSYAVSTLQDEDVWVYLDAGHSNWVTADVMAERLQEAGIGEAHGFALNVSNYNATEQEVEYAAELNDLLGTPKPFVVDTSRNGNGSNGDWCNPDDREIGRAPSAHDEAEMLLWLKVPGESDGNCGIGEGTAAGQFSPELATSLINET